MGEAFVVDVSTSVVLLYGVVSCLQAVVLTKMSGGGIPVSAECLKNEPGRRFSTDYDNDELQRSGSGSGSISDILQNGSKNYSGSNDVHVAETEKHTGLLALFEKKMLPSTLIYMFIWFSLSFGSYGISTWITVLFEDVGIGNVYASAFIFALANLPGNIVSILYVEQIGRRQLLFYGMLCAGLSTIGFALGTSVPAVVVVCATLFNAFSVAGW